jgi:hypothetical protein
VRLVDGSLVRRAASDEPWVLGLGDAATAGVLLTMLDVVTICRHPLTGWLLVHMSDRDDCTHRTRWHPTLGEACAAALLDEWGTP